MERPRGLSPFLLLTALFFLLLLGVGCTSSLDGSGGREAYTLNLDRSPTPAEGQDQAWQATVAAARARQEALAATATANAQVLAWARATEQARATATAQAVAATATAQFLEVRRIEVQATSTFSAQQAQATATAVAQSAQGTATAIALAAQGTAMAHQARATEQIRAYQVMATSTSAALNVIQTQAAVEAYEARLKARRMEVVNRGLAIVQVGLAGLIPLALLGLALWVTYQWARLKFVEGLRQEMEARRKPWVSITGQPTLPPVAEPQPAGPTDEPGTNGRAPSGNNGRNGQEEMWEGESPPPILDVLWREQGGSSQH